MPVIPFHIRLLTLIAGMSAYLLTAADFRIDDVAPQPGRSELRFSGDAGFYYMLWRGDSITDIRLVTDLGLSSGAQSSLTDTNATNSAQFYRVEKVPLTSLRDTDGDGISDAWELLHRHPGAALNPVDANEDHDSNGTPDKLDAMRESLRSGAVRGRPVLGAGAYHTLAIKMDGTLWGWGDNIVGELGSSAFTETNSPTQIGTGTNWSAVSVGGLTSYGLKSDGTLWTWGQSSTGSVFVPTQVGTNTDWIGLPGRSADYNPTALGADGTRWQFVGSFTNAQPLGSNDWAAVTDGYFGAHWAIKNDGTLWQGLSVFDTNPVWSSISVGSSHVLALHIDGTLWAWVPSCCAQPFEGELGLGDSYPTIPTQVGTDTWAAVIAGSYHSVGIKSDGSLWWWGMNFGFPSDGAAPLQTNVPTRFGTNADWIAVAASERHTAALRADGTVWTFGVNELGKLGNGTVALVKLPCQVGTEHDWSAVAIGSYSSFALKTNGTLWSWGYNGFAVLGVSNFLHATTLQQVPGSNWIAVSGGHSHTLGLQRDGSLWRWGRSLQMNALSDPFTNVPVRVGTDTDWKMISAGRVHSLALKNDGSLWSWGQNPQGELGTGGGNSFIPLRVGGSTLWTNISAGYYNSLGVQTSSSLWSWGRDANNSVHLS